MSEAPAKQRITKKRVGIGAAVAIIALFAAAGNNDTSTTNPTNTDVITPAAYQTTTEPAAEPVTEKAAEPALSAPAPEPAPNPTYVAPTLAPTSDDDCNPNYSGCVENSPSDLDCPDIGQMVSVIGYDEYNLDRDGDGYGCESYR